MWCEVLRRTPISQLNQDLSEIKFQLHFYLENQQFQKKKNIQKVLQWGDWTAIKTELLQ